LPNPKIELLTTFLTGAVCPPQMSWITFATSRQKDRAEPSDLFPSLEMRNGRDCYAWRVQRRDIRSILDAAPPLQTKRQVSSEKQ
jgi:hypothetical protein